jgi:hypothetical protein
VQIEPRDGAWVAEATGLIPLTGWPPGTRLILRKERPHPGAQLRITDADGLRVTGLLTRYPPRRPGRAARRPGTAAPSPRPGRGRHPVGERHRAAQPALPRHQPKSHLFRHQRARAGPAGLVRAAHSARHRSRLRTQTATAADPGHRRTTRPHRARPARRTARALTHHHIRPTEDLEHRQITLSRRSPTSPAADIKKINNSK